MIKKKEQQDVEDVEEHLLTRIQLLTKLVQCAYKKLELLQSEEWVRY